MEICINSRFRKFSDLAPMPKMIQLKRKTTETLIFQPQQMEASKQNQKLPDLYHYSKKPGHYRKDC